MLMCLIAFVLGYLVARMMRGNGLSVGGEPAYQCRPNANSPPGSYELEWGGEGHDQGWVDSNRIGCPSSGPGSRIVKRFETPDDYCKWKTSFPNQPNCNPTYGKYMKDYVETDKEPTEKITCDGGACKRCENDICVA
jgi:hypothetical protein